MKVIVARASTRYQGRADAELELSDVVITLLDDGAAIVHCQSGGVNPKNWAPTGSVVVRCELPGVLELYHAARDERLEIFVHEVHGVIDRPDVSERLTGVLNLLDAEAQFSDLLSANLDLVDPSLELVGREFRTDAGPIDLLAIVARPEQDPLAVHRGRNPDGWIAERAAELVVIEVKRKKIPGAGAHVVAQVKRYWEALRRDSRFDGIPLRGVIVAPGMGRGASKLLAAEPQMTFCRLDIDTLRSRPGRVNDALEGLFGDLSG